MKGFVTRTFYSETFMGIQGHNMRVYIQRHCKKELSMEIEREKFSDYWYILIKYIKCFNFECYRKTQNLHLILHLIFFKRTFHWPWNKGLFACRVLCTVSLKFYWRIAVLKENVGDIRDFGKQFQCVGSGLNEKGQ